MNTSVPKFKIEPDVVEYRWHDTYKSIEKLNFHLNDFITNLPNLDSTYVLGNVIHRLNDINLEIRYYNTTMNHMEFIDKLHIHHTFIYSLFWDIHHTQFSQITSLSKEIDS